MNLSEPKHITIAGNVIVDTVKTIERYPEKLCLVQIEDINQSMGGLLPNVAIDLAILDPTLQIHAIGHVGDDANADYALQSLSQYPNLDTRQIHRESGYRTAFTDVMTVKNTGERTFFTHTGADALLNPEDFDFSRISGLLHLGYILLLPGMDAPDPEYGTRMARVLATAQRFDVLTSVDVVSEDSDRYRDKVLPALQYVDYLTINETETERTTGIPLRTTDGILSEQRVKDALFALRESGVRRWITIHAPEGAWGLDENNTFAYAASEKFPVGYIRSTVGAGDAFAAGILLSIIREESYQIALELANTVAGMSLAGWGSSDGLRTWEDTKEYLEDRKRRQAIGPDENK